ncbi:MAG: hypothetical protein ACRCUY_08535 [Thermoguttaceae bacterium]
MLRAGVESPRFELRHSDLFFVSQLGRPDGTSTRRLTSAARQMKPSAAVSVPVLTHRLDV